MGTIVEYRYDYRVLVDNVPTKQNWTFEYKGLIRYMEQLREVNPHAIIHLEISPWVWDNANGKWEAHCPGCEYADCPTQRKQFDDVIDSALESMFEEGLIE